MSETAENPIRKWRVGAELSLEQACDKFVEHGYDRPSTAKLSRIETGQAVPVDMIEQFAAITGLSAKEISPKIAKIFEAKEDAA
jgi:hypothetical protein